MINLYSFCVYMYVSSPLLLICRIFVSCFPFLFQAAHIFTDKSNVAVVFSWMLWMVCLVVISLLWYMLVATDVYIMFRLTWKL